ncbi:hypothetical protein Pla144_51260 [Bythopirellula polymerisocia]|uniref:Uncharacterized protein n=1 Tax=Bythopirellula polymerisocia TaxID=2528003 RepID=A0A5C6BYV0_9BACT|nr:hypothetical protein Pla144_51260 [Bythopirellula polymerisocia]
MRWVHRIGVVPEPGRAGCLWQFFLFLHVVLTLRKLLAARFFRIGLAKVAVAHVGAAPIFDN